MGGGVRALYRMGQVGTLHGGTLIPIDRIIEVQTRLKTLPSLLRWRMVKQTKQKKKDAVKLNVVIVFVKETSRKYCFLEGSNCSTYP